MRAKIVFYTWLVLFTAFYLLLLFDVIELQESVKEVFRAMHPPQRDCA